MECGATDPQDSFDAQWEICSPSTVPNFSASGYFFGRKLYQELGVVIGLVDISYGGASIHTFMDEKTLEGEEESAVFRGTDKEGWEAYQRRVEAWEKKGRIDKRPYFPPQHFSELCYNAMVHPLVPFASRGGIWYQGESNAAQPDAYVSWFGDYICMMREKFNNSGMPFYFVQLAGFENQHNTSVPPEIWAVLADGSVLEVEGRIKSDHTIEIKASNMERLRYAYGNYPEVENKNHMPLEVVTLAERLKESGYHTAHIGKWHLTTSYPGLEMEGSPEMTKCYDFYF